MNLLIKANNIGDFPKKWSKTLEIWVNNVYNVGDSGKKWVKVERRFTGVYALKGEVELMFLGRYEHTIDSKGRLIIPARYRDLLAEGAFITQGFDQNLMVLTSDSFEKIFQRINQMSLTDPDARQLKRLIFSTADQLNVDKTGRILIPAYLRESADLDGNAVIVGTGGFFEIWSPEIWMKQATAIQDTQANTQRFATFDLSL